MKIINLTPHMIAYKNRGEDLDFSIDEEVRIANINGELKPYYVCDKKREAYSDWPVKYIGSGYIHSIDGVEQCHPEEVMHFWVKK